jgi:hypothetical protein
LKHKLLPLDHVVQTTSVAAVLVGVVAIPMVGVAGEDILDMIATTDYPHQAETWHGTVSGTPS